MFVHGDKTKMESFAPLVQEQLHKPVFMPPNHQQLLIPVTARSQIPLKSIPLFDNGYLIGPVSGAT